MRKSTTYHYSEGDVRRFVKDELKTTNKRIDTLSDQITEFKNKVYELFDKVMGELKAIREEQTVISGYKDQIEEVLTS